MRDETMKRPPTHDFMLVHVLRDHVGSEMCPHLDEDLTRAADEIERLGAQVGRLRAALLSVESIAAGGFTFCPSCSYVTRAGHADSCVLAAALSDFMSVMLLPYVGCRVKVTHPEIERHPRKHQTGMICHIARGVSLEPSPDLLWVRFDDGHRMPFWPNELTLIEEGS